jgi:hypothetical protein
MDTGEAVQDNRTMTPLMKVNKEWPKMDLEFRVAHDLTRIQVLLVERICLLETSSLWFADPYTDALCNIDFSTILRCPVG